MANVETNNVIALASRDTVRKELGNERYRPHTGGRVLQVIQNVDMRNGQDGLAGIAKEKGVDVFKLLPGQYVVFVNTTQNKLKLYACAQGEYENRKKETMEVVLPVITSLNLPSGMKFDPRVIQYIPKAFNGGKIDFDKALKESVEEAMRRRSAGRISGTA